MADILPLFRTSYTMAGTGHRPNKLAPPHIDAYSKEFHNSLTTFAVEVLTRYREEYAQLGKALEIISGMALGWDMALADASVQLGIPFIAAVPCRDQERTWSLWAQAMYHALLKKAAQVVRVTDLPYSPFLMNRRNEWLVDRASLVLACWSGSVGGTSNAVRYAQKKSVPIDNVWLEWLAFRGQDFAGK